MTIEYKLELLSGFYNNHTMLAENNLYEIGHKNSVFKSLLKIDKEFFKDQKMSTVIAYDNNKPIGFILFEHYDKLDNGNFTFQKIKRYFLTFGSLMMYVKPEYRKRGIACKMVGLFEEKYKVYVKNNFQIIDQFAIINASGDAHSILCRTLKSFVPSYTGRNDSKNKQDLISILQYHPEYKPLSYS